MRLNISTRKGANAAPILELASKKQKVAFRVAVGKSSDVWSPQQSQNMVATAFPNITSVGWNQTSPSGVAMRAIPNEPQRINENISVQTRPTCDDILYINKYQGDNNNLQPFWCMIIVLCSQYTNSWYVNTLELLSSNLQDQSIVFYKLPSTPVLCTIWERKL